MGSRHKVIVPAATTIGLIHALGVNCMYGLVLRNGYVDALKRLYTDGPFVLPGSNNPILTRFIGIPPLDKVLTLAVIMFSNVLDGSTPQSSLYSYYFAGQLVPVWVVMMMQGLRQGEKGLFSVTFWECLMQGTGYGFIFPIYCIVHLLHTQPAVPSSISSLESRTLTQRIETIPVATVLGYIVPSFLMSFPLPSNNAHQWLTALWQGFPVWVCIISTFLHERKRKYDKCEQQSSSHEMEIESQLRARRHAYDFAFVCASITHLSTLTVIALRSLLPLSSTITRSLSFHQVFIPPRSWSVQEMPNMAIGIQNFFQYDQYIGSTSAVIWAVALHRATTSVGAVPDRTRKLVVKLASSILLGGPAGFVSEIMWERDLYQLNNCPHGT